MAQQMAVSPAAKQTSGATITPSRNTQRANSLAFVTGNGSRAHFDITATAASATPSESQGRSGRLEPAALAGLET